MRQPNVPPVPTPADTAPTVSTAPAPVSVAVPRAGRVRRPALRAVALGLLATVAACGNGHDGTPGASTAPATPSTSASSSASSSASPSTTASGTPSVPPPATSTAHTASCVERAVKAMSRAQQVGQLFMSAVSSTGMTTAQATAITRGRVGSVILFGHTDAGAASVRPITQKVQSLAPVVKGVQLRMLVSTDQEGGQVQVLNGPGFSAIPSAVTQGTWSTSLLRSSAADWGRQLKGAGVNMNLAPVADTVPPDLVDVNAPIGQLDREFGTNPAAVSSHSDAFLGGMLQAGVITTAKHFPGLGRVHGNTDLVAHVVDGVTTRDDPFLQPFRSAVRAGTPFVMVSSAIYSRIDPDHVAAFSPTVIRGVLRGSLGFQGAIVSDDLGKAVAVLDHTPAQRALDFISAGGNLVLTVRPSDIVPMTGAVLSRMSSDTTLRESVDDSVRRVLTAKLDAGLLTCD
ncbi:glycoside hydrolase family 3 N-terminal domain-containing protein [Streptomyces polygonati]|uniref:beta-N-acetylhexosaminidase n=1 Tax=Streptomyces polygonati TaxID=1617087 RepID=A0ABV8HNX6_9ACTN